MISAIITSYREPKTIGRAIECIAKQLPKGSEILVTAPDRETLDAAAKFRNMYKNIRLIKDRGEGKPAALNLAVSKAKGDILILTDGDVYVSENAIKELMEVMKNRGAGAASGNPLSVNDRKNKYGFWAYMLTEVANETRIDAVKKNREFFCSGYLFAIRKKLFPRLPKELLSEDGYISYDIYKQKYRIGYAPNAKVYIKYPDNFSDWIKQKKRSAGGYNQIKKMVGKSIRSFGSESMGAYRLFKYISGFTELIWLIELFFARIYLWFLIYRDINLKKKSQKEIWERVESTK